MLQVRGVVVRYDLSFLVGLRKNYTGGYRASDVENSSLRQPETLLTVLSSQLFLYTMASTMELRLRKTEAK